jgi:hypothetical protein
MKYVLITYVNEAIAKEACRIFESDIEDIETDPYTKAPFALGSNQAVFHIEDAPYVPKE